MDGFEANSIIKSDNNMKSIPVIALTASAMKEDQNRILSSGFDHFLPKPISQKKLIQELSNYLNYKQPDPVGADVTEFDLSEQKLSTETIERLPELIEILEGKMKVKWESIRSTFILTEIESFAGEIKKVAENFKVARLSVWSDKLIEQTQNLDMENLPSSINHYENFIFSLKKLIDKEGKHDE